MNTALATVTPKESFDLAIRELESDEPSVALRLREAFDQMFADADRWEAQARSIRVTSEDDHRGMKLARETRLALREIRVKAEKARKRLKESAVREGRAIDGIANVLKALIEPLEEKLMIDETFAERAEEQRIKTLGEARSEALKALGVDPASFVNLGAMTTETWDLTIENAKRADADRKAEAKKQEEIRLEAERLAAVRAEEERQAAIKAEAERVERERLQAEENAKLKAEAEARELEAKAEREKHAAEQEAARAEKARIEAEAAKVHAEIDAKARAAEAEKEKAQAERDAARETLARAEREGAERVAREKAEAEKAAEAAALAPDKDKLRAIAAQFRSFRMPSFTTKKGKDAGEKVVSNITRLAEWLEKTAGDL